MRERFFEAGHKTSKQLIQEGLEELEDYGISSPNERRNAVNIEHEGEPEVGGKETKSQTDRIKTGKISAEKWQDRLDQAFANSDFSFIKTLQQVKPGSSPSAELVVAKMDKLITTRPGNWVREYKNVQSVSSVETDEVLVAQEFGKLFEQFGNEKGILDQLKSLKQATKYTPPEELIQTKYRNIFAGKKSYSFNTEDLIEDVRSLTGIQPDEAIFQEIVANGDILHAKKLAPIFGVEVTSEMIQQTYEAQFTKNGYLNTSRISEIGEKPNPDLVARAYQRIIEKRGDLSIDSVKSLEKATGVKPVFTEEQMRPVFEEFLQRGWYGREGYVGVEHLTEMSGIRPPVDLVEETALTIIDGGHGYIDQGKAIKSGLHRLKEGVSLTFEIPEQEIQARYKEAMDDKKPHVISNIYGALGIRPEVDEEEARRFMVGLIDETYHNPIKKLEDVFGIQFEATEQEIELKLDENLEKLNFDALAKIKELTGKDCDPEKLEVTLIQWLEKEAVVTSVERGDFSRDWDKPIKQRLKEFGVAIPPDVAIDVYMKLIQNETVHSKNLFKTYQLTNVPIPAELAQQAYRKYLSPDYAYSIKTDQGICKGFGSLSGAFEELFKITGIKPEIPTDQLQAFYRDALVEDSWERRGGIYSIETIAGITGVKPEFDRTDINRLYKEWILAGRENQIENAKKVTGIEFQLDDETLAYVSEQIESAIEKACSSNYEKEEYGEKKFDTFGLERDLNRVGSLLTSTGIKPNPERLQSIYHDILINDPYWNAKIEQIFKSTGIKPEMPADLIQTKGQALLEQGALRGFQRLQKYGQFTFTPEIAEKAYAGLLATSQSQDDFEPISYYNRDWMERIKKFRELSGFSPTDSQLSEIFGHMIKDGRVPRKSYNLMSDIVELFEKDFGAKISEAMATDIYKELFIAGNLKDIEEFKKKTGITPEISIDIVRGKCDDLLQKRDFSTLKNIKAILGLEALPLTPEIVQTEYAKLVENPKLATYGDKDIETFYALYELTQVRPELSVEQTAMVYRRIMFEAYDGSYEKFEQVVGAPPIESDLQNRIYNWLVEDYIREDIVTKFMEKYKVTISPEIANKAAMRRLEKAGMGRFVETIKTIKLIEEISGSLVRLEVTAVENATQKVLETHKSTAHSCTELDDLFSWFEESTGQKPPQRLVDLAYTKTLDQTISYEKTETGDYLNAWDWLKQKYGLPSREAVQAIYLAQLSSK